MLVDDQIKADWHESYVRDLFEMSGYQVTPNPLISGKTPDLLVTGAGIPDCIVECKVVERETGHEGIEHGCGVSMDSSETFRRLYSKVEEKVAKYCNILQGRAYVVAVYDEGCFQTWESNALPTAAGSRGSGWKKTPESWSVGDGRTNGERMFQVY